MIEVDVTIAFKKTHRRISDIMHRKIKEYNLTFRLFHILKLIREFPEANQKDLAVKMQLTQGAISGSIKRLLELEMINVVPMEHDNRYNKLELTQKGNQVLEDYYDALSARFKMMFNDFDEDDFIAFDKALKKLNKNIDEINIIDAKEGVIQ